MYTCALYCLFSDVQSLPSKVVLPWLKAAPKAFASLSGLGGRSTIAGGLALLCKALCSSSALVKRLAPLLAIGRAASERFLASSALACPAMARCTFACLRIAVAGDSR